MKVLILTGGLGMQISEEIHLRPKPMKEVRGRPILKDFMKIYSAHAEQESKIATDSSMLRTTVYRAVSRKASIATSHIPPRHQLYRYSYTDIHGGKTSGRTHYLQSTSRSGLLAVKHDPKTLLRWATAVFLPAILQRDRHAAL